MPLGAMLKSTMYVGVKSMTQVASGEWKPSFSYTNAVPVSCRIYDRSADARQSRFGDSLGVEAVVLIPFSAATVTPLLFSAGDGERQQVKVDGVLYEVLKVRDQGHVGRIKELWVKRWK